MSCCEYDTIQVRVPEGILKLLSSMYLDCAVGNGGDIYNKHAAIFNNGYAETFLFAFVALSSVEKCIRKA